MFTEDVKTHTAALFNVDKQCQLIVGESSRLYKVLLAHVSHKPHSFLQKKRLFIYLFIGLKTGKKQE